jgi:hypothetical protein
MAVFGSQTNKKFCQILAKFLPLGAHQVQKNKTKKNCVPKVNEKESCNKFCNVIRSVTGIHARKCARGYSYTNV